MMKKKLFIRLLAEVREQGTGNGEQLQELTEKAANKYFCMSSIFDKRADILFVIPLKFFIFFK
ncbi:MAG: hypothetical protein WBA77_15060 [Microcoleaceae cyanobacterium]